MKTTTTTTTNKQQQQLKTKPINPMWDLSVYQSYILFPFRIELLLFCLDSIFQQNFGKHNKNSTALIIESSLK